MSTVASPDVVKTLDDLINLNSRFDINKVTYYTQTEDKTLIIPDTNLFQIYKGLINGYVRTYKVNEAQQEYYQFRPYLLSTDIYGTPALGWLILFLNDRECASKFYLKDSIRIIPKNFLEEIYDTIVAKANKELKKNWNGYLAKVGEDV